MGWALGPFMGFAGVYRDLGVQVDRHCGHKSLAACIYRYLAYTKCVLAKIRLKISVNTFNSKTQLTNDEPIIFMPPVSPESSSNWILTDMELTRKKIRSSIWDLIAYFNTLSSISRAFPEGPYVANLAETSPDPSHILPANIFEQKECIQLKHCAQIWLQTAWPGRLGRSCLEGRSLSWHFMCIKGMISGLPLKLVVRKVGDLVLHGVDCFA